MAAWRALTARNWVRGAVDRIGLVFGPVWATARLWGMSSQSGTGILPCQSVIVSGLCRTGVHLGGVNWLCEITLLLGLKVWGPDPALCRHPELCSSYFRALPCRPSAGTPVFRQRLALSLSPVGSYPADIGKLSVDTICNMRRALLAGFYCIILTSSPLEKLQSLTRYSGASLLSKRPTSPDKATAVIWSLIPPAVGTRNMSGVQ